MKSKLKIYKRHTYLFNPGDRVWINYKGRRHRDNGPAVERIDGTKYWLKNGKFHRLDGPAIEYSNSDSDRYWYIEGERYTEEEFKEISTEVEK